MFCSSDQVISVADMIFLILPVLALNGSTTTGGNHQRHQHSLPVLVLSRTAAMAKTSHKLVGY